VPLLESCSSCGLLQQANLLLLKLLLVCELLNHRLRQLLRLLLISQLTELLVHLLVVTHWCEGPLTSHHSHVSHMLP
jgi:hypothetical protein